MKSQLTREAPPITIRYSRVENEACCIIVDMRIGIDARLYTQTGVGRYIRNLISELGVLDKENEYYVYLRKKEFTEFTEPSTQWHKRLLDISWHTVSEQLKVPFFLLADHLDVAHFPYFNVPILYPKKYLLTVHDLIVDHFDTGRASTLPAPFYKMKRFGYHIATHLGARRASAITAISETTKQELVDHYHIPDQCITVTYDALDTHFVGLLKKEKPKNHFSSPYILYVGNAYPHKNLERLLTALPLILKKKKMKLVLAGDDDYFYPKLKAYAEKLGIASDVVFFGAANDGELIDLYTFSSCVVFPSLMEGFGLPNLEALACGILPVISDIPVFREIWGNNLPMFNPYDEKNITVEILRVLSLPQNEYKKKVQTAQKKLAYFSWKRTAADTLNIYTKIVEK